LAYLTRSVGAIGGSQFVREVLSNRECQALASGYAGNTQSFGEPINKVFIIAEEESPDAR
jgi:hypothetical protein